MTVPLGILVIAKRPLKRSNGVRGPHSRLQRSMDKILILSAAGVSLSRPDAKGHGLVQNAAMADETVHEGTGGVFRRGGTQIKLPSPAILPLGLIGPLAGIIVLIS